MSRIVQSLILGILVIAVLTSDVRGDDTLKRLRRDLLTDYDSSVRPVRDPRTLTNVSLDLLPIYLKEMDGESQVFSLNAWLILKWEDEFLSWDPKDYDGLEHLRIPSDDVWLPDITIYNTVTSTLSLPNENFNVVISYTGKVVYFVHNTFTTFCQKGSNYPAQQSCNIDLGSWTYSMKELLTIPQPKKVSFEYFKNINPRWELESAQFGQGEVPFDNPICCPETYGLLQYVFNLKQKK